MRKGQRQGEPGGGRADTIPQEARGGIEVLSGSSRGPEALKAFSQFGPSLGGGYGWGAGIQGRRLSSWAPGRL